MESKIFIDVDADGQPQIRIDYKHSGDGNDVRDKLIGRFLFEVYATDDQNKTVDVSLDRGNEHPDGMVAFIRLKKTDPHA